LLAFLFMLREIFDGYGLRHICFAAALRRNHSSSRCAPPHTPQASASKATHRSATSLMPPFSHP
jgi:hypothetical protein